MRTFHDQLTVLAQQQAGGFDNRYLQLAFAAVLGFFFSWALEQIKSRRAPRRTLTWTSIIESKTFDVGPDVDRNMEVLYRKDPVKELTVVRFTVLNSGNTVVKNEELRFAVPEGATILDFAPDPDPEPELEVTDASNVSKLSRERLIKIGHLEKGQNVQFVIVSTGGDWSRWQGPRDKNPDGDVGFVRGDIARVLADQEHVRPFLIWGLLLFVIPSIVGLGSFGRISDAAGTLATLVFLVPFLRHVAPVARIVERLIADRLQDAQAISTSVVARGGSVVLLNTTSQATNGIQIYRNYEEEPEQTPTIEAPAVISAIKDNDSK